MSEERVRKDRRTFITSLALGSLAAATAPGFAAAEEEEKESITAEVLAAAEKIAGLSFTGEERDLMLEDVRGNLDSYQKIRELNISNEIPPALHFMPLGSGSVAELEITEVADDKPLPLNERPAGDSELAFLTMSELAELVRTRKLSSRELTSLYLQRLKKYDPKLECVITLTEERAIKQAEEADAEISRGNYRGPLHGIPWGAKDLLAVQGYPTTWGAMPYKDQQLGYDATTVQKLDAAGAVLIAKLTLGALAWGDVWYGGTTKNPWNLEQGSSGSSAGPAAASSAGLAGFTIGSETWGSIVSPSTRCGATGLRPTFGRVGRGGAMALSWSMDKLGPIARSVEDCAHVFSAIHGHDPKDPSSVNRPFAWQRQHDPASITVGYTKELFENEREDTEWKEHDLATLSKLEEMGYRLKPISLPDFPIAALSFILSAEAATAFDQLTLSNEDDKLVRQIRNAWPNSFRASRFIPAVEYVQANRARFMLMQAMEESLGDVDLYLCPSFGGNNLLATNLTGHPAVVLPNGFRKNGTPTSITFMGRLYGEGILLSVADAYQKATEFHRLHPKAFY